MHTPPAHNAVSSKTLISRIRPEYDRGQVLKLGIRSGSGLTFCEVTPGSLAYRQLTDGNHAQRLQARPRKMEALPPIALRAAAAVAGLAAPSRGIGSTSALTRNQPFTQCRICARLPAGPRGPEPLQHIGIEADRGRDFGRRCRPRPTNASERFELFSTQFTRVGISLDTGLDGRVLSRRGEPDPAARLSCHVLGHIFESPACLPYAG